MTENDGNPSSPPLIGITGPRLHAAEIRTTPSILLHAWVDSHYTFYPEAVARAGGLPVHLAREANAAAVIARLDGLIVSGGHDVDPRAYGREPTATTTRLDPGRDAFELALIEAALEAGIPVLGICRGAQLMNIARGGTLHDELINVQQIEHTRIVYPPETRVHPVHCRVGSVLHGLYGEVVNVNSFHHQSIDAVGRDIEVTAVAADDTVEAIEIGSCAVGVQWHPEMLTEPDPLFDWLVAVASVDAVEHGEDFLVGGPDVRGHRLAGA
ncbi:MAG: gamma-glutamyl-gamma-aminobutyrate hydrolase family protein [Solirubrobacterales bacterium]